MSVSMSPRKIEMIAGGASFAPSRWSLPALAMLARSSPCHVFTARITAAQNTRNCMLSCGFAPGRQQVVPLVVAHRPVQVLARAVHARERLLVQQARQPDTSARSASASPSPSSGGRSRRSRSRTPARSHTGSAPPRCAASSPAPPPCTARVSTSDMNAMHPVRDARRNTGPRAPAPSAAWPRTASGPALIRSGRDR